MARFEFSSFDRTGTIDPAVSDFDDLIAVIQDPYGEYVTAETKRVRHAGTTQGEKQD